MSLFTVIHYGDNKPHLKRGETLDTIPLEMPWAAAQVLAKQLNRFVWSNRATSVELQQFLSMRGMPGEEANAGAPTLAERLGYFSAWGRGCIYLNGSEFKALAEALAFAGEKWQPNDAKRDKRGVNVKFVGELIFDEGKRVIAGTMEGDEILAALGAAYTPSHEQRIHEGRRSPPAGALVSGSLHAEARDANPGSAVPGGVDDNGPSELDIDPETHPSYAPSTTPRSVPADWQTGAFKAWKEQPGHEHAPWFLVTPNGCALRMGYHNDDAEDQRQAEWLAAACNAALGSTPDLTAYPNLQAILSGTVSGHHTEWPAVRAELHKLLAAFVPSATPLFTLDTAERVCFYEQEFYVLSNFSSFKVNWMGVIFNTSEHAYHWTRFPHGSPEQQVILESSSAHDAFRFAQTHKSSQRADWDEVKVQAMREILFRKVEQHEYVRRKLLESGNRELVENSWRDDFWGWGPNRDGKNMLGKLWMEVRAELRRPDGGKQT